MSPERLNRKVSNISISFPNLAKISKTISRIRLFLEIIFIELIKHKIMWDGSYQIEYSY